MIVAIGDTHTTIWYLFSDSRLGKVAPEFIDSTIAKGDHIGVSAISVAEMIYHVEKGRIPASAVRDLHDATANQKAVLQYVPLDEHVAMKMAEIPRQNLPDLPDRVVAATALFLERTGIEPRRTHSPIRYKSHLVIRGNLSGESPFKPQSPHAGDSCPRTRLHGSFGDESSMGQLGSTRAPAQEWP
jgi:PIN domain nuclease of toxin-antitoxin system